MSLGLPDLAPAGVRLKAARGAVVEVGDVAEGNASGVGLGAGLAVLGDSRGHRGVEAAGKDVFLLHLEVVLNSERFHLCW